ncbi:MAG: hypothetical protein ACYCWE_04690 [Eubacteriales bacterium]
MKKHFFYVLILLTLCAFIPFSGCSQNNEPSAETTASDVTETAAETVSPNPGNMLSKAKINFAYNTGASESTRSAVPVNERDEYGCRFYAAASFDSVSVSCPSYSDNIGSLTISLYRWETNYIVSSGAAPVAEEIFVDFNDNATLTLSFAECESGEYILVLSEGSGGVGVWMFSESKSGTFIYSGGLELNGVFTMSVSYTYTPDIMFREVKTMNDFSKTVTTPTEVVYDSTHPTIARDAMPDTWVATDGLGRTLPTNAETGDVREGKYIGLFFWTWHVGHSQHRAINVTKLMEQYPEIQNDYNNPLWKDYQTGAYHWNEPIYGYYDMVDKWVLRKQAEMLANSGVDVVFFDNTNGTMTWRDGYLTLCEVFSQARKDGVKTPKISFLLPFADGPDTVTQLREIYLTIYRDSLYQDLWFYWEGKPLLMSHFRKLDRGDPVEAEIYQFFTFRPGEPSYVSKREAPNTRWGWLSVYPQAVYQRKDGTPEQMTVGVAQNHSKEVGLTAMNGLNIFGRTYTSKGYDTRENAKLYGANFEEQFEYALDVDPDFIFITGWNEWVAGRYKEWCGVENAFPDQFSDSFSRDIEPSKGDLADNYYYQLVSFIRRYKGTRALPAASEAKKIDIYSTSDMWADVTPRYIAYAGNTFDRDCDGYGDLHYTDTTGRNDITEAKAARDADHIYFMVECADAITPYTDPAWMRLLIDIEGVDGDNWKTFEYIVNRTSPSDKFAVLERSKGGWNWEKAGDVEYSMSGNRLQIKIPRAMLGIEKGPFTINFKWSDHMQTDGDIMDFYVSGDVAPGGRFKYQYKAD